MENSYIYSNIKHTPISTPGIPISTPQFFLISSADTTPPFPDASMSSDDDHSLSMESKYSDPPNLSKITVTGPVEIVNNAVLNLNNSSNFSGATINNNYCQPSTDNIINPPQDLNESIRSEGRRRSFRDKRPSQAFIASLQTEEAVLAFKSSTTPGFQLSQNFSEDYSIDQSTDPINEQQQQKGTDNTNFNQSEQINAPIPKGSLLFDDDFSEGFVTQNNHKKKIQTKKSAKLKTINPIGQPQQQQQQLQSAQLNRKQHQRLMLVKNPPEGILSTPVENSIVMKISFANSTLSFDVMRRPGARGALSAAFIGSLIEKDTYLNIPLIPDNFDVAKARSDPEIPSLAQHWWQLLDQNNCRIINRNYDSSSAILRISFKNAECFNYGNCRLVQFATPTDETETVENRSTLIGSTEHIHPTFSIEPCKKRLMHCRITGLPTNPDRGSILWPEQQTLLDHLFKTRAPHSSYNVRTDLGYPTGVIDVYTEVENADEILQLKELRFTHADDSNIDSNFLGKSHIQLAVGQFVKARFNKLVKGAKVATKQSVAQFATRWGNTPLLHVN